MEIIISGRHTTLTQALQDYARQKVEKLEKFFDGVTSARVTLTVEDNRKSAELVFSVVKGKKIVAAAEGQDMYAAIDMATQRMKTHLTKYKAKLHLRPDPGLKEQVAERESSRLTRATGAEEEEGEDEGTQPGA